MLPHVPRLPIAIALLLAFGVPASAPAQALPPAPSLDEIVTIAKAVNPDVVLARLREDSARGEQRIARALPAISVAAIPQVPYQYSISAPIDVGPQRVYRTRAASSALLAAQVDIDDVQRQVVYAVRQAFYDLLLAQAQRDIARERQDIFGQVLASDSARLKSGDIPELNVARSELEFARAESDLTRADAATHSARLALQLILGVRQPDTAFTVTGALTFKPVTLPEDSLVALASENRPDLRAARVRIDQSRALLDLSAATLFPTPAVSLVYQNGVPFGNGSNYALGVGFSLPLLYWNGGERERARAGVVAANVAARRTEAQAANDVQTALDAYRAARGLAERYESGLLAKAQHALDMARYAYRTGATSLLDLLDAVRTYADTRSEYNTALHDYWVSAYAIDRAVGKDVIP
jgi:cobalt-zinc-cadmium efflux system outer membrane protein